VDAGDSQSLSRSQGSSDAALSVPRAEPMPTSWEYRDNEMNIQGPFTGDNMREWLEAGYLPTQLELRRQGDVLFVKLSDLMRTTESPFDTYEALDAALDRQRQALWGRGIAAHLHIDRLDQILTATMICHLCSSLYF
jgi:hypothetical protein